MRGCWRFADLLGTQRARAYSEEEVKVGHAVAQLPNLFDLGEGRWLGGVDPGEKLSLGGVALVLQSLHGLYSFQTNDNF